MSRDKVIAYKRVIRRYLALGVTRQQVAEAVSALRDGSDPDELASVLGRDVPGGLDGALADLPMSALTALVPDSVHDEGRAPAGAAF